MNQEAINRVAKKIMDFGPDRVMVSHADSETPKRAREEYNVVPDIIFIRGDGWSLGAPKWLKEAAYRQWDDWEYYMVRPETTPRNISEYKEQEASGEG